MLGSEENKKLEQVPTTKHHHHDHHHNHNHRKKLVTNYTKDVPKGCLPIKVGQGEDQEKIVVPVMYLNHPLFSQLLKEAEEEYGFDQQGTIIIPCHVEEFRYIQDLIDRDNNYKSPQNHHHHHHHAVGNCFKGSSPLDHL